VKWRTVGAVGGRVRGPTLDCRWLIDPEAPMPPGGRPLGRGRPRRKPCHGGGVTDDDRPAVRSVARAAADDDDATSYN